MSPLSFRNLSTSFTFLLTFGMIIANLIQWVNPLHFYIQHGEPREFLVELATGTDVLGTFKTEEWSESTKSWIQNLGISVRIEVIEQNQRAVPIRQLGLALGNFTFTSPENGNYEISFMTNSTSDTWFKHPKVRFHLDLIIGEDAFADREERRHQFTDLTQRVNNLVNRAVDIRREQQFQREREATFRDLSEIVNSRIVSWTIVQMCVLAMTCIWQLRHLRTFFTKKKLV